MTANRTKKLVIWIIFILFGFTQLFPLIWMIDSSFLKSSDFFSSSILKWPAKPEWQNYVNAWVDGKIIKYSVNSILVTFFTILLTVFLSLCMAYAFTRMRWKLRNLFFTIILLGIMIPIYATLLPNFAILRELGLINSHLGLILPYTAFNVPFGTFILSGFIRSTPSAIEESAVIDGCSIYRILFQVITPLMMPAIVTIAITTFLGSWNEYILASTFLSSDTFKTLPFAVVNFAGQYSSDYGAQFAVMVLTSLPSIIIYAIFNEQITKGVTAGAVKG